MDSSSQFSRTPALSQTTFPLTINGVDIDTVVQGQAINPATGEHLANHALADLALAEKAVEAARRAFDGWCVTAAAERRAMLLKLGDLISTRREAFIELLIAEQGKPRAGAEWEIDGSVHWLREIAEQALQSGGDTAEETITEPLIVRRVPLGVVAAITPWNFPLLLAIWKIAPALASGNTVIVKPSPFTPLCTLWFGELAQSVLPPGVLNVIAGGNELGQFLVEHEGVDKIEFTGSTETAGK